MCSRPRWRAKRAVAAAVAGGVVARADEVDAGAVAVVVDGLLDAVAVGVELGADVGERVPLRRVLQRERDHVVGPHVDVLRVAEVRHLAHVDVVEGGGVALHVLGGREHAAGGGAGSATVPPGKSSGRLRQKLMPASHLAHALEDLLGREQVDAPELVVVAPVAPRRAVRALLPTASSSRYPAAIPRMKMSANGWATSRAVSRPSTFSHRYV